MFVMDIGRIENYMINQEGKRRTRFSVDLSSKRTGGGVIIPTKLSQICLRDKINTQWYDLGHPPIVFAVQIWYIWYTKQPIFDKYLSKIELCIK